MISHKKFLLILTTISSVQGHVLNMFNDTMVESSGEKTQVIVQLLTFEVGDTGSPPHRHPGTVEGYVFQGEFLFQLEGGPLQILTPPDKFYEGKGAVHVWGANASNSTVCKVIASVFAEVGKPVLTTIENYPRDNLHTAQRKAVRSSAPGNTQVNKVVLAFAVLLFFIKLKD